ncbi:MAG TPA: hypothetical protein DCQ31_14425 [Bacteroidales bacterium]|nr:hypothetical protein [Bacteroidales bacterium]
MNRTIFIHVEEEFLIAGTETFQGKFRNLSGKDTDRFWFYFFINKHNNRIDYGYEFRKPFQDNEPDFIGNFLDVIIDSEKTYEMSGYKNRYLECMFSITEDLRDQYFAVMHADGAPFNEKEPIPISISFSDNVTKQAQTLLSNYFTKRNYTVYQTGIPFPVLWTSMLIKSSVKTAKYAIIEAFGNNLNMSAVTYSEKTGIVRTHYKSFNRFGTNPAVHIIAHKIVNDANKLSGLLTTPESIEKEVKRHFLLAENLVWQMNNSNRPYLHVTTQFDENSGVPLNLTLSVDEIRRLTLLHIHQLSMFFEDNFLRHNKLSPESFDAVILLGDTLAGDLAQKEFLRFGSAKIRCFANSELKIVLPALAAFSNQKFDDSQLDSKAENTLEKVEIGELMPGNQVVLHTFDPTPGKGKAMQHLAYVGNNTFEVVASTRSLQKGDLATALETVWLPGMKAHFEILRNKSHLGRFETRPIKAMELF